MTYAPVHARASRTVARKGAEVTFSRSVVVYDPVTDTSTTSTTTVTGAAVQDDASKHRKAGEIIAAANTVLFFTPTTRGQLPAAGDSISWQSVTQSVVKTFGEIDPDGQGAFASYVEIAR